MAGVGVSHVLGVGGRDLSEAVGGLATLDALAALDADPATERVLLVSKPPAPSVAAAVEAAAAELSVPVRSAVLSPETPDLTAAVEALLRDMGLDVPTWPSRPGPAESRGPGRGPEGPLLRRHARRRGDAAGRAGARRHPLEHPAAARARPRRPTCPPPGHVVIDFGDDALTVGRAHPMIDPTLRLEAIAAVAAADEPAVLLLDVVLGYGADPDPAALARARADRGPRAATSPVVVALVGTEADPQGWSRQADALAAAGAAVFASNAAATRYALDLLGASA